MTAPYSALLIDDEPHIRTFIRLLLQRMGVKEVFEASNGQEGIEIYKRDQPEIVLLDVNMPVMGGMDTLKLLCEYDPDVIVVMLTAEATRQMVEKSGNLGAYQFIRKDAHKEEIVEILTSVFDEIFE